MMRASGVEISDFRFEAPLDPPQFVDVATQRDLDLFEFTDIDTNAFEDFFDNAHWADLSFKQVNRSW